MSRKNIITLGIISLIILVGVIVVIIKGFNVGLSLRPHHTFYYVFEQEYNVKDVRKICKEVFGKKDFRIRGVEVFNDAIYIETSTINKEEEKALVEKLNNLYKNEETQNNTSENIKHEIYYDSNIKILDEINPYILPIGLSSLMILIYSFIRFRKLNNGKIYKTLANLIVEGILIVALPLSIMAIIRLPIEMITFSILIILEIAYLIIKFIILENKLKEV